jgi:hypothetical protein
VVSAFCDLYISCYVVVVAQAERVLRFVFSSAAAFMLLILFIYLSFFFFFCFCSRLCCFFGFSDQFCIGLRAFAAACAACRQPPAARFDSLFFVAFPFLFIYLFVYLL